MVFSCRDIQLSPRRSDLDRQHTVAAEVLSNPEAPTRIHAVFLLAYLQNENRIAKPFNSSLP